MHRDIAGSVTCSLRAMLLCYKNEFHLKHACLIWGLTGIRKIVGTIPFMLFRLRHFFDTLLVHSESALYLVQYRVLIVLFFLTVFF